MLGYYNLYENAYTYIVWYKINEFVYVIILRYNLKYKLIEIEGFCLAWGILKKKDTLFK